MYLFLSLLQARVGSSLVSHLGNLAPEAVLRTPVAELAGRAKISGKASRAFEELQRALDRGPHAGRRGLPGTAKEHTRPATRALCERRGPRYGLRRACRFAKSFDDGHRDGQGPRACALRAGCVRGEWARARGGCGCARGGGRGRGPYSWRTRVRHRRYVSNKIQTEPSYAFALCSPRSAHYN